MTEVELIRDFRVKVGEAREFWPKHSRQFVDDATLRLLISEGACVIVERKAHGAAPENKGLS